MEGTRKLELLSGVYAVCRLDKNAPVPGWATLSPFLSITRTADEVSVVCLDNHVPAGVAREGGWRVLMVQGPLAFALTGVLASLAVPLAREGISIFAVSTYDTDYLLVKAQQVEKAVRVLSAGGYEVDEAHSMQSSQNGRAAARDR